MKKIDFYKSALAVLTAGSIILMGGCTKEESNSNKVKYSEVNSVEQEPCIHLTVCFGNETVTFKECDGYEITSYYYQESGIINYSISKDGQQLMSSGHVTMANYVDIYHDVSDDLIEVEAIQKSK